MGEVNNSVCGCGTRLGSEKAGAEAGLVGHVTEFELHSKFSWKPLKGSKQTAA